MVSKLGWGNIFIMVFCSIAGICICRVGVRICVYYGGDYQSWGMSPVVLFNLPRIVV